MDGLKFQAERDNAEIDRRIRKIRRRLIGVNLDIVAALSSDPATRARLEREYDTLHAAIDRLDAQRPMKDSRVADTIARGLRAEAKAHRQAKRGAHYRRLAFALTLANLAALDAAGGPWFAYDRVGMIRTAWAEIQSRKS